VQDQRLSKRFNNTRRSPVAVTRRLRGRSCVETNTGAVVEEDVRTDIRKFRELEIPLAQVGIEHWQEIRGSYEFSKQWWHDIDDLVKTAHDNGYKVHVWHFPYMNAGSKTHYEGVQKGYFIRNRLGLPYHQRIFHGIARCRLHESARVGVARKNRRQNFSRTRHSRRDD